MPLIYVVFHDDQSQKIAQQHFSQYSWARLIRIPSTKYCESFLFTLLDGLSHSWDTSNYVGIIAYSLPQKIGMKPLLKAIEDISLNQVHENIIVLNPGRSIINTHPGIKYPLKLIMNRIGFDKMNLNNVSGFFNNYWIAQPSFMKAYIKFFLEVKQIMDHDHIISLALTQNSYYPKNRSKSQLTLMRTFGTPYYTWHPFVCERLICIFSCLSCASIKRYYNSSSHRLLTY